MVFGKKRNKNHHDSAQTPFFLEGGGVIWLKNETLYLIKKQRGTLQTKNTKSNELFQEDLSIEIF